jgi:hypothetical protein
MEKPIVNILHTLPGRIRVSISWPPKNIERFQKGIIQHDGINSVKYNPLTKSILIYYNPTQVSQMEIVVRVAISLSLEYNLTQVSISKNISMIGLSKLDYYSGISLLAAWGTRLIGAPLDVQKLVDWNGSISTIGAILKHAYLEVKNNGMYDLEVLSIVYLINSILKGNLLLGAAVPWLATFTRHILEYQEEEMVLKTFKVCNQNRDSNYYDVVIRSEHEGSSLRKTVKIASNSLNKLVGVNPNSRNLALKNQLRRVSKDHGSILEGISNLNDRIYLRLEF